MRIPGYTMGAVAVGREPDNDLVVRSPLVSRYHVRFVRDDRGWRYLDLDSARGTWLNGLRMGTGLLELILEIAKA